MYLDSGLRVVETFMEPLLENVRERVMMRAEIYDPKSRLQEWAQAAKLGTPHYVMVAASGPDHARVFEVEVRVKEHTYGKGSGPSKQIAERIAAQSALEELGLH
jgi:ribonuclease-3